MISILPEPFGELQPDFPRPTKVTTVYSETYALSLRRIKREKGLSLNIDIYTDPDVITLQRWVRDMVGTVEANIIFEENL